MACQDVMDRIDEQAEDTVGRLRWLQAAYGTAVRARDASRQRAIKKAARQAAKALAKEPGSPRLGRLAFLGGVPSRPSAK